MEILAYDIQGVILCHFVPHGETVNAQYYAAYLQNHLCHKVRRKWSQLQNVIFFMITLLHVRCQGSATTLEVGRTEASTILTRSFALWLWFNPQVESSIVWAEISYTRWHCHCSSTLDYDKLQPWWSHIRRLTHCWQRTIGSLGNYFEGL